MANAIYDGTDAVMLSGETAMGKYPVEALSMMSQIAETTEFHLDHAQMMLSKAGKRGSSVSSAVAYASVSTAQSLSAQAIITPTISGERGRAGKAAGACEFRRHGGADRRHDRQLHPRNRRDQRHARADRELTLKGGASGFVCGEPVF